MRFQEGRYIPSYKPTIGADFLTTDVEIEGQKIGLQIWDTAGQERFLSIGNAFYKGSDCCVITFDVTQPKTFTNLEVWKKEFETCLGFKDNNKTIPFILLGNKVDLINSRKVSIDQAKEWCKHNGDLEYFETSAKDGTAVKDAFVTAGRLALKNRKDIM